MKIQEDIYFFKWHSRFTDSHLKICSSKLFMRWFSEEAIENILKTCGKSMFTYVFSLPHRSNHFIQLQWQRGFRKRNRMKNIYMKEIRMAILAIITYMSWFGASRSVLRDIALYIYLYIYRLNILKWKSPVKWTSPVSAIKKKTKPQ